MYGSLPPKIARVGTDVGDGVERVRWVCGPTQSSGDTDHPVERDRPVEAPGRRGLERLHAAHAEAHHRDLAHVVVHDEVVGRGLEVADLQLVVELRDVAHPRRRVGVAADLDRRAHERLGRAHREPVGGEAAAQVVEQRPHAHDVGVQHEPGDGHAVGAGVDGVDRGAVGPLERDVLDVDSSPVRVRPSDGDGWTCPTAGGGIDLRRTARGSRSRRGGTGLP